MLGICDSCKQENIEVKSTPPNSLLYIENPEDMPNELKLCMNCYVKQMTYEQEADDIILAEARKNWNKLKD